MKDKRRSRYFPSMGLTVLFFLFFLIPASLRAQSSIADDTYTDPPYWRQALGGAVTGHPVAQAESVVATTDGGNLKSYSSQGNLLWDYFARGRLTPFVSRSREGTSYICRTNGLFIAVNRVGRELWQINLRTPIVYPVLIGWDSRLFIFTDKRITCMTAAGYTLWSWALEKKTVIAPIRDAVGGVILVQEDGEILRFSPFGRVFSYYPGSSEKENEKKDEKTEEKVDEKEAKPVQPATEPRRQAQPAAELPKPVPVAAASLVIEGWGLSILLLYKDRHLELVYPALGYGESLKGKLDLPSAPLAATGRWDEAAVLFENGQVALLSPSPEKRKILWTASGHIRAGELPDKAGPESLDLFYDERGIYVLTKTGATGFAADGRRLWYMRLRNAVAIPSFGDDGILYAGGADWILYAYRLEDRVRATQRVLYGEAPEGSYGTGSPGPSSWADYPFRFSETDLDARLAAIRRAVRDGNTGANEREYAAWLMETAGSLMANPMAANNPPVQARYRVEATSLLAYMGSRETIPFLADLFSRDPEATVKAAAALAIGRIGVDPDGLALRAFENAIVPPSPPLDEAALTAIASATGALCRFSGPPLSAPGIRILTLLSAADRPPSTRSQAQRELRSLGR